MQHGRWQPSGVIDGTLTQHGSWQPSAVTDRTLVHHGSWQTSVSIMLHPTNIWLESFLMEADLRAEEVIFQLWALLVEINLKIWKNITK
jgi:hypothetical protein